MATMTLSHDWRCLACKAEYYDPTDQQPCPSCGNDAGHLLEAVQQTPAVKAAQSVMQQPAKAPAQQQSAAKAKPAQRGFIVWDRFPGWFLGTLLLGLWLAFGGKYTIDGLPLLLNLFAGWFHLSARLPPVTDGMWYLRLSWLIVLISVVERQYRPWRRRDILSRERLWLLLVWVAVIAIDAGSTFLAVRSPVPDAWPITLTVAALPPLALLWSLLTTFGPESGLSWLTKWLRGA